METCDFCKSLDEIRVTTMVNIKTGQNYKIGHRCFNKYFNLDYIFFMSPAI